MNTDLVVMTMAEMMHLAKAIAESRLFGFTTPQQALALMAIAQAEGRHPAAAARDYDIIQGRPAKKTEAMHRDYIQAGGKIEWLQLDDAVAEATFTHPAGSATIRWDMARAAQAGLGGRDMWKKYPRQMLRNRCISEGIRTVYPLATSGMYEPGEAADIPPPAQPKPAPTIDGTVTTKPTNGNGAPPDLDDIVDKFDQAQARITNSDDAQKLLDWHPGIVAITVLSGEKKRQYLAMRDEVMRQWIAPPQTAPTPPQTETVEGF